MITPQIKREVKSANVSAERTFKPEVSTQSKFSRTTLSPFTQDLNNISLQDLIKTGITLLASFTKDIELRTNSHSVGQINFKRPKSLTETDFSSRPSSTLFAVSVALNKALLTKFKEKDN